MFCLVYNKFVSIYKILYRTTKLIMNVSFTPGRISYKASVTVSRPWTAFKLQVGPARHLIVIHKAMLHSSKLQITTVNLTALMLHTSSLHFTPRQSHKSLQYITGVRCRDICTSKSRSEEETEPEDNESKKCHLADYQFFQLFDFRQCISTS